MTTHGRLDVMMNNVGVNFYGKVHETSEEDWAACLNLNLGGVYRGMREAIPHLLRGGGGSIVNTASNQGLVAFNGFAAYAAAKGAIVQLTRQAALDYAPDKIRVNCICPGAVRTPMNPEAAGPVAGRRGQAGALVVAYPDAADRRAGGDRPGGALPGERRIVLGDRPRPGDRRRRDDQGTVASRQ